MRIIPPLHHGTSLARHPPRQERSATRWELYQDRDGVIIGATGTPNGFNTMGNSLNLDRRIGENVLWRIEARMVQSEDKIFVDDKAVASQSNTFFTTSLSIELP